MNKSTVSTTGSKIKGHKHKGEQPKSTVKNDETKQKTDKDIGGDHKDSSDSHSTTSGGSSKHSKSEISREVPTTSGEKIKHSISVKNVSSSKDSGSVNEKSRSHSVKAKKDTPIQKRDDNFPNIESKKRIAHTTVQDVSEVESDSDNDVTLYNVLTKM